MNEELIFRILNSKDSMYDLCENMEQVYDNFYEPLYAEYQDMQKILMDNLNTIRDLEKKQDNFLQQENKQLKDNWNKLKEYLLHGIVSDSYIITENCMLAKMQKLESSDNNE